MSNVTIENPIQDGSVTWSDLVTDGKIIGALAEQRSGLLNPLNVWAQVNVPEYFTGQGDYDYPSEDKGKIFVCFYEYEGIDKLAEFVKLNNL